MKKQGLLRGLFIFVISSFAVAVAYFVITLALEHVPDDPIAQEAADATVASTNVFKPAVSLNDLWIYVAVFAVLVVLAMGYKFALLFRGSDDGPG